LNTRILSDLPEDSGYAPDAEAAPPAVDFNEYDEDEDELPPIDLPDDLFASVAQSKVQTSELEEPDVSWFLNMPKTGSLEAPDDDSESPTLMHHAEMDDQTLNWLSEIENIVTSATNKPEDEPLDFESIDVEAWSTSDAGAAAGRGDDFTWGEEDVIEEASEPPPAWLTTVEDLPSNERVESAPPEESEDSPSFSPPPPSARTRLSGLLHRAADEPEAESIQPVPAAPLDQAWEEVPEAEALNFDWETPPAPEAEPLSLTDARRVRAGKQRMRSNRSAWTISCAGWI
jgi:hypothetical protein